MVQGNQFARELKLFQLIEENERVTHCQHVQ